MESIALIVAAVAVVSLFYFMIRSA